MANVIPNFRLGIQLADNLAMGEEGERRYTPWAKDGSGWSEWAFDSDQFDPDGVKVGLETEPGNLLQDRDLSVGVRAADGNRTGEISAPGAIWPGAEQSTMWASAGGGCPG